MNPERLYGKKRCCFVKISVPGKEVVTGIIDIN
jgi:hypothetical protein